MLSQLRAHYRKLTKYCRGLGAVPGLLFYLKSEFGEKGNEIAVVVPGVRHPIVMRRKTAEAWMFSTVFIDKDYKFHVGAEPQTIVDLGAHIGMASVYFANRFPNAKIIAIEPSSRNFMQLKRNTQVYDNITALHAAIWPRSGSVTFANPDAHSSSYRMRPLQNDEPHGAEVIRAMTMEQVLSVSDFDRIDILKIDIEGAELPLFEGNTDWLSKVDVIAIELHDRFAPGCKEAVEASIRSQGLLWSSEHLNETTVYRLIDPSGPPKAASAS